MKFSTARGKSIALPPEESVKGFCALDLVIE